MTRLVEIVLGDSTRRKLDGEIPQPWIARAVRYQRPGFPPQILLTSMLDYRRYPAREITALYHERWELILPERCSTRSFPRAVKIKMSNYPRKRPLAEAA